MDAVRADRAINASGVKGLIFTEAPAAGGGVRSADLPSQIFDFIETGTGFEYDDGLDFQRGLLDRMPSQIAGLEVRLEEAEAKTQGSGQAKPTKRRGRGGRWGWVNHPWTITVAGTVIGGVILAAILGLFH